MTSYAVYVLPAFVSLLFLELMYGYTRNHLTYRLNDTINSLSLGFMRLLYGSITKGIELVAYGFFLTLASSRTLDDGSLVVWAIAMVAYDFLYYWRHRYAHEINVLWAAHVVHHQSENFNLSTALRQTSTGFLFRWVFYIPMALAGVPVTVFAGTAAVNLFYQFWVHTEHVPKLGWFEALFVTPSNHRVHHGQNERYVDKNYGGVLIIWDRWFGTFQEELPDDPVVYGVRAPLRSWNPLWANIQVYTQLWRDSSRSGRRWDRLLIWWRNTKSKVPGGYGAAPQTAGAAGEYGYDTSIPPMMSFYALAQFFTVLMLGGLFLSRTGLSLVVSLSCILVLSLWMCCVGWLLEGRPDARRWEGLRIGLSGAALLLTWSNGWLGADSWLLFATMTYLVLSTVWLNLPGATNRDVPTLVGQGPGLQHGKST